MRTVFALFVAFALTAPAFSQVAPSDTKPGSRIPEPPPKELKGDPLTPGETRQVMAEFATCVTKKYRKKAEAVVLEGGWSDEAAFKAIVDYRCLDASMERLNKGLGLRIPSEAMSFAIAEALLADEWPAFRGLVVQQVAPLKHPIPDLTGLVPSPDKKYTADELAAMQKLKSARLAKVAFARFGECVVRADWQASHRLLKTTISSKEEGDAFVALAPAMNACIQKGVQFKANKTMIRGVVAVTFYRLLKAPRLPAQVAGAPK